MLILKDKIYKEQSAIPKNMMKRIINVCVDIKPETIERSLQSVQTHIRRTSY